MSQNEVSSENVGVVIPTYREEETISSLVEAILNALPNAYVVVVDDSPDEKTKEEVLKMNLSGVHVIKRKAKDGRGTAVVEGVQYLVERSLPYIFEMDADFSHPPSQMPEMIKHAQERQLDMLIGSRYIPGGKILNWPWNRLAFSWTANFIAKTLLRVPVKDYTNGFRLYSLPAAKVIADNCGKLGSGFISLSEILVNIYYRGLKVGEVPTTFVNRARGQSSLNAKEIWGRIRYF